MILRYYSMLARICQQFFIGAFCHVIGAFCHIPALPVSWVSRLALIRFLGLSARRRAAVTAKVARGTIACGSSLAVRHRLSQLAAVCVSRDMSNMRFRDISKYVSKAIDIFAIP